MGQLNGQIAVVTGGGAGIGRAIATTYAAKGATIAIIDRDLDAARETARFIRTGNGNTRAFQADVSEDNQVKAAFAQIVEAFSTIDVLVNNAAISRGDNILTIDTETWDLNLDVALKSVFLCSKEVLPGMMAAGRGVILNIASVNGLMGIGEEPYSAAKAGVINLTKNLALRYGRYGIRVNAICPGSVVTPAWQKHLKRDATILDKLASWYPLGRVGKPEDIANAALFLASNEAEWITGAILAVDGGLTAGSYRMFREIRD